MALNIVRHQKIHIIIQILFIYQNTDVTFPLNKLLVSLKNYYET
jgi:hypothetical protein